MTTSTLHALSSVDRGTARPPVSTLPDVPQPGVLLTPDVDDLRRIAEPGLTLTVWCRDADPGIARELKRRSPLPDFALRCELAPAALADHAAGTLAEALARQGLAAAAYPCWLADLTALSERFAALVTAHLGQRRMTLRLEALAGVACPRLHVDQTRLRLLCTYRGPGTDWLPPAAVNRAALTQGAPNAQIADPAAVRRLAPFWVGLFKGERYPGNAGRGQVHRSPTVEPGSAPRLLFCLDA